MKTGPAVVGLAAPSMSRGEYCEVKRPMLWRVRHSSGPKRSTVHLFKGCRFCRLEDGKRRGG